MLKNNTVKKNFEFQKMINSEKQVISDSLIVYYKKNNKYLRVGISVSKKFANAVYRNKERRQIKGVLDEIKLYDLKFDVIIIVRKKFLNFNYEIKKREIKKILEGLASESK